MVKMTAVVVLAMLMLLGSVSPALASPAASKDVQAVVAFTGGGIEIDPDPDEGVYGFSVFEAHFGTRKLPTRRFIYYANGSSDNSPAADSSTATGTAANVGMVVVDRRANPQLSEWTLNVKLTRFVNQSLASNTFGGTMTLHSGQLYSAPAHSGSTLTLQESGGVITIPTSNTDVAVMKGTASLGRGAFGCRWSNGNIRLTMGDDFRGVVPADYVAEMTWTIVTP